MGEGKRIWARDARPEALNEMLDETHASAIGIQITKVGATYLEATMPVDRRTVQPFGILHGGASVALSETLGSIAAHLVVDSDAKAAVGLEINANHIRAVSSGSVRGRVEPVHIGRSTHVWQTQIYDDQDRLVCISRLTVAIIDK